MGGYTVDTWQLPALWLLCKTQMCAEAAYAAYSYRRVAAYICVPFSVTF
ncbi:MAG: hypothetical protein KDJ52_28260 [Anaerolineae bacterium]|nr:hypothetical protein [Anaerolineae bacterium]